MNLKLFPVLLLLGFSLLPAQAGQVEAREKVALGVLQDPPAYFCIKLQDTEELAVLAYNNKALWEKKVSQGKCGEVNLPFFYSKLIEVAYLSEYPSAYIMEMKLKLLKGYVTVYRYLPFEPSGMIPIRDLDGKYAQNPARKEWFDSLQSLKGSCCSNFDGRPPEAVWEISKGHYMVKINGAWYEVPDEAVIQVPNLYGVAVIWYSWYFMGDVRTLSIRCFLPGTMS